MVAIHRQRVEWTGFRGAPGLSTFYFTDAPAHQAALRVLLNQQAQVLPTVVTMTIQPTGDVIDTATGLATGTWVGSAQAPIPGTVTGDYAAPVGLITAWTTNAFAAGRRIRGRNFFVPGSVLMFDTDGSIANAHVTNSVGPIASFIAAVPGNFLIWRRPRPATPAWTDVRGRTHPAKPARAGEVGAVVAGRVVDKACTLRSRRD